MTFFESVLEGAKATSLVEWLAVTSSVIYVILASKQMILCWFFAFVGSILFVYLCYSSQLYLESILQVFYVVMAIVGWIQWNKASSDKKKIKRWSFNAHLINILLSGIIAYILGFLFDEFTEQANPYIDSFTTVFSLAATFMVTKKVLGNWIYWIVIDIISVYLYAQRDYNLAALQFVAFTILAIIGFIVWKKEYDNQMNHTD